MLRRTLSALALTTGSLLAPVQGRAQMVTTEEKFHDLFVTAGYGTAFGAAFGAALLSFQAKPQDNLRFVAVGASVGFIGGSLLGTYVIFAPAFAQTNSIPTPMPLADRPSLRIVPSFDPDSYRLAKIESQWTLFQF